MYKPSRFNTYVESSGDLQIINSLSEKLVIIPAKTKVEFLAEVADIGSLATPYLEQLAKYGLIVPTESNEKDVADVLYQDYVTDNKLTLLLIPIYDCNFRCKYCYESFNDKKMTTEIIARIEKYVKANLHDKKSLSIGWFGGEPLMAFSEMVEIMDKLKMLAYGVEKIFTQGIITNGYYLTPEVVNTLVKYKCMHIQVTLDGLEANHDTYRPLKDGQGTFATIVNNLRYIRDHVKSRFLTITLRANITLDMVNHLPEYVQFLEREFAEDRRFQFLWRFASDWGGESVLTMEDQLGDLAMLKQCFAVIHNSKLNGRAHTRLFRKCGTICDASKKNYYVIGPDAKVFKCTMKLYADDAINNIGYLDENGIMVLDKTKEAHWRVKQEVEKCNRCSFYAACFGMNCVAQRIYNKENSCPYDKTIVPEILSLLANDENGPFIRLTD